MSVCVHHKAVTRKVRARKFQVTQAQRQPAPPEPFAKGYKPKALYVVFDLETTGLVDQNVEIVNIALEVDLLLAELLHVEEDEKMEDSDWWFESLVKPKINTSIPAESAAIHGISDADVAKAPSAKAVLQECFERWLPNLRAVYQLPRDFPILIVAHNNHKFDQIVLQTELLRCGVQVPADVWFGDTWFSIKNAFGYSWTHCAYEVEDGAICKNSSMSLQALVKRVCLREGYTQQHSAMHDVESLLDVMHAFRAREDLYEALWQDKQAPLPHKQLNELVEEEAKKVSQRKKFAALASSSNRGGKRQFGGSTSNNNSNKYKKSKA